MASVKMEVLDMRSPEHDNGRMPDSDFAVVSIDVTHIETYEFRFRVHHDPVVDDDRPPPVEVSVDKVTIVRNGEGRKIGEEVETIFNYDLVIPGGR